MKTLMRTLSILILASVIGFGTYFTVQLTSAAPASSVLAGGQPSHFGGPYGAPRDGLANPRTALHGHPDGSLGNNLVTMLFVLAKFSGVFAVVAIAAALIQRFVIRGKKREGMPEPFSGSGQGV